MKPALLPFGTGLGSALFLAACSPETAATENKAGESPADRTANAVAADPRIVPIPPIPAVLRGCWLSTEPDDPAYPGGRQRLVITGTTITQTGEIPRRVATAEFVQQVSSTSIEGRFSARENGRLITIATGLELVTEESGHGGAGQILLREGDAGSWLFDRCPR